MAYDYFRDTVFDLNRDGRIDPCEAAFIYDTFFNEDKDESDLDDEDDPDDDDLIEYEMDDDDFGSEEAEYSDSYGYDDGTYDSDFDSFDLD